MPSPSGPRWRSASRIPVTTAVTYLASTKPSRQPWLRAELAGVYRQFLAAQRPAPAVAQADVLLAHGCPGEAERARWQAGALELVLAPCSTRLLGSLA